MELEIIRVLCWTSLYSEGVILNAGYDFKKNDSDDWWSNHDDADEYLQALHDDADDYDYLQAGPASIWL